MPTAAELDEAVRLLEAGELVAFPTETVYGLGADAENPEAVARIFAAKGRPSNHPVIVHVVDGADVGYWSDDVPDAARKLIDAFWPGPLTIILKRAAHIPAAVAGGQDSIGLRCPSHPVAQALLSRFRRGRAALLRHRPTSSARSARPRPSMCATSSVDRSMCSKAMAWTLASNRRSSICPAWIRLARCCCARARSRRR
jgi:tRNA threonylcarbamoyl adenosine modification protein (Sua5/YciO/YrdC/YwlC family)